MNTKSHWPFVESPGDFAERLRLALAHFNGDCLAAVRNVLIETPPTIAELESLRKERDILRDTLTRIAAIDPAWGDACCFKQAQGLARAAMKPAP